MRGWYFSPVASDAVEDVDIVACGIECMGAWNVGGQRSGYVAGGVRGFVGSVMLVGLLSYVSREEQ